MEWTEWTSYFVNEVYFYSESKLTETGSFAKKAYKMTLYMPPLSKKKAVDNRFK